MTRYYLDTEFNEHGGKLISLALVTDRHVPLYIINDEPMNPTPWVSANVLVSRVLRSGPVQPVVLQSANQFGEVIRNYIGNENHPVIIADSPVDIWRFCQVLSTNDDGEWASADYPMMTFEVHNVDCYPTDLEGAIQHNALWDAMALRHKLTP